MRFRTSEGAYMSQFVMSWNRYENYLYLAV
jgi:hypothetical protein